MRRLLQNKPIATSYENPPGSYRMLPVVYGNRLFGNADKPYICRMTTTPNERYIHHGRNIKRFREMMSLKQEDLADRLGDDWSQKKVSQLESKEEVDDAILEQVAHSLNVSADAIKNYSDEATINYFNTFTDSSVNNGAVVANNCVINSTEEWLKSLEENKKLVEDNKALYERLLKSEQEKVALLEKMLDKK